MTAVPAGPDTGVMSRSAAEIVKVPVPVPVLELSQMSVVHLPAELIAQSCSSPGVAHADTPAGLKMSVSGASFPETTTGSTVASAPVGPE